MSDRIIFSKKKRQDMIQSVMLVLVTENELLPKFQKMMDGGKTISPEEYCAMVVDRMIEDIKKQREE